MGEIEKSAMPPPDAGDARLLSDFQTYMRRRNLSANSQRSYLLDVRQIFLELFPGIPLGEALSLLKTRAIQVWMADRMQRGAAPSSVNRHLASLGLFLRFARGQGLLSTDPMLAVQRPREPKRLPQGFRQEEVEAMLAPENYPVTWLGRRDRAIVLLLYLTGMRSAEVWGLTWGQVDSARRVILVHGKGDKQRFVPYTQELETLLTEYRQAVCAELGVNQKAADPVFLWKDGTPLTGSRMGSIVRAYTGLVTQQGYRGPHALRHSCATHMLENGASIMSIKEQLGHSSLDTTQIYTHTNTRMLIREYSRCHPHASGPRGEGALGAEGQGEEEGKLAD